MIMEETRKFHLTDFLNNRLVCKIKLYETSLCLFCYVSYSFHCKQSSSTLQKSVSEEAREKHLIMFCMLVCTMSTINGQTMYNNPGENFIKYILLSVERLFNDSHNMYIA